MTPWEPGRTYLDLRLSDGTTLRGRFWRWDRPGVARVVLDSGPYITVEVGRLTEVVPKREPAKSWR